MRKFLFATLIFLCGMSQSIASIALTSIGNTTLDFNTLPTTTETGVFSNVVGTQAAIGSSGFDGAKIGGSGVSATGLTADTGSTLSGGIYSYGAASVAERALGMLASGTNIMAVGVELINNTGSIIEDLTITFTQENWRSSTTNVNTISASYSTTASSSTYLSNATLFTAAPTLNLVGPVAVVSNAALDGNLAGNQVARTMTLASLNLPIGASIFFRWQDVNETGNDAGLAIDNFSITTTAFSAVPEPSSFAGAACLGWVGLFRRRRKVSAHRTI